MKKLGLSVLVLAAATFIGTARAGDAKTEQPLRLALELVSGSRVIGVPGIESVSVQTSFAKMKVTLKEISAIKIAADHENVTLDFRNGDKLKGVINLEPIKLDTIFGTVSIGIEHIRCIDVLLSGGALADGLTKGLVLHYSFDRDEGGKVKDESGSGNDGEIDGAKWIEKGGVGGAYVFNGRNARIVINNSPSLDFGAGARTIAAWIKSSGASGSHQEIFNKGTNPGYAFRLAPSPDRAIEYFKSAGANYSFFTSSHTIADDAWHHLAVVDHGDGTVDFYKDGAFMETVTKTNYNSDSAGRAAIGAWTDPSFAQGFNGAVDEVTVYDRALTAEEVSCLSRAGG
jgi:hypothetical protein